mmetsp:Transcript_121396/g.388168  ORF Transcript_121396/g.388168 Transcript_121396/m.388168 type:complete len:141 (-) Transcript_121396:26-448(-)
MWCNATAAADTAARRAVHLCPPIVPKDLMSAGEGALICSSASTVDELSRSWVQVAMHTLGCWPLAVGCDAALASDAASGGPCRLLAAIAKVGLCCHAGFDCASAIVRRASAEVHDARNSSRGRENADYRHARNFDGRYGE